MTTVIVSSPIYGDTWAVASEISHVGVVAYMSYAPPVGTPLVVHFQHITDDDMLTELSMNTEVIAHGRVDQCGFREVLLVFKGVVVGDGEVAARVMH